MDARFLVGPKHDIWGSATISVAGMAGIAARTTRDPGLKLRPKRAQDGDGGRKTMVDAKKHGLIVLVVPVVLLDVLPV